MTPKQLSIAALALMGGTAIPADALELYVDTKTQQVFTAPGKGRVKLGTFEQVGESDTKLEQKKAELEQLSQKLDKQKAELTKAQTAAAGPTPKTEKNGHNGHEAKTLLGDNGLEFESPDGNFKAQFGGRLQIDGQANWNQNEFTPANQNLRLSDGTTFRRARLYSEGTLYKNYTYRFEYDFVRGNGLNSAGITDAFLKVKAWHPFDIVLGQFKEPISLESVTSNRFLSFMERSLPNNAFVEFANPYMVGTEIDSRGNLFGNAWTNRLAFQTESVGPGSSNNSTDSGLGKGNGIRNNGAGNTGYGVTTRLTYAPLDFADDEVLHTGVSLGYRAPHSNLNNSTGNVTGGAQFASQADAGVDRTNVFNTGNLTTLDGARRVDHFTRANAELAGVYGPFSVQGEYFRTQISGKGYSGSDVLVGYYAFASYFLTGENRNYDRKRGVFARLTPKSNFDFSGNGWGAWELAYRWDYLDLNTPHISGGRGQLGTLALNWYINSRVRFMANYIHMFGLNQRPDAPSGLFALNGAHNDIFQAGVWMDW